MPMTEQEAITIADRVLERVRRGVPSGREIHADEIIPVLCALAIWKAHAEAGAAYIADAEKRALE